ncbi:hypothetical protein OCU04_010339 [Sclerotinia nivalis]|uniref:Uncharacterized protein n=1 Tax=Sclerotinia nivalis TaxID=352851 RepID=A0A9X0AEC4_9HELO|nr:hypothetical protein OCU04_010339 [Sclerotinia nivalis]
MSQLPDSELDDQADENGAEEAEYQSHGAGRPAQQMQMQLQAVPTSYSPASNNPFIAQQHLKKKRVSPSQSIQNVQSFEVDTLLDDDSGNSDNPPNTPMEIKQF